LFFTKGPKKKETITMTKKEKLEQRDRAIERLTELLKPGMTVYTIMTSVSRSGMYRHIRALTQDDECGLFDISGLVAKAIGWRWHDDGGVGCSGCGMDMGFHLVYTLSQTLFPNGFECTGAGDGLRQNRCPSNDHTNGDRNYEPHHHNSGGYALRHQWI
jgi:hypothetical protein